MKDYPDAKRILNARARKLMKENEERLAKEMSEQQKQRRRMQNLHPDFNVAAPSSDQVHRQAYSFSSLFILDVAT